ncbi:antibiotic biosynthesis monooxygenase family protein [Piscinibacter terrae]|uniref:Antibiotic biosynthesis monooxygenase n=1 Tax=Piscinibacter terrae TaxID=2496871 RepID=A0A3N7HRM6_9BURK|nr:antibiotic biosynthesis monooxygenase family protein [Albitalea terrae]RQP23866.1 antibiotic biosynthesis monooxygenase [Albitalea terrae]
MVIEYIRYGLTDDAQATAFERDYALAARFLDDSEHCLSYQLARCVDQPLQYILQIRWDSADGHLQGFRRSAGFADFVRLVGPYTRQLLEMRHYQPTAVAGARPGQAL